jgi:hypothetical protein
MKISVIMGARYRATSGPRCLKSVLWQSRPPHEIVMVDCGENEWAADLGPFLRTLKGGVVEFKYYRYTQPPPLPNRPPEFAYTNGVNEAWGLCTGDYIFITPTDALAPVRCIEASMAMQVGTSRVCHLCYGLNRATTERLDDPDFRWAGTDMRLFHSLPGFTAWFSEGPHWPPPNDSPVQQNWWGNTVFSSNTRDGWEDCIEWGGLPFPTREAVDSESWFWVAADERGMGWLEAHDGRVRRSGIGKRPLTKCPVPIYHQWHPDIEIEDVAHGLIDSGGKT